MTLNKGKGATNNSSMRPNPKFYKLWFLLLSIIALLVCWYKQSLAHSLREGIPSIIEYHDAHAPQGHHQEFPRIEVNEDDATMRPGDWDASPIVVRKYKLIFFALPKNACEEFKKLFRRIEGYADWQTSWNHPPHLYHPQRPFTTLPHDPGCNGLTYFFNMNLEEVNAIINDRAWTKAIFLRDPLVRFLSAYIDKIVRHNDNPKTFGLEFHEFVGLVENGYKNVHWGAQCELIDCAKWLPRMDFIGSFQNMANDTESLLRGLGAWDEFGMTGWGPNGTDAMFRGAKNEVHAANTDAITRNYYKEPYSIERVKKLMAADLTYVNTSVG